MNNQQLQEWINQHGGVRDQGITPGQDQYIDNPNYDPFDPDSPKKIKNPAMSTTIITNDNSKIVLAQTEGSSSDPATRTYDVLFSGKATAATADKPAAPPAEEPDPTDPTKTRIWDPSLNNGAGGWKPGVAIAPKPSAAAGSIIERPDGVYIVKPDGSTIKTALAAKPAPGSSQTVRGGDGKTYVLRVDAEGNVTTTETDIPGEPTKEPSRVTDPESGQILERQPDGSFAPIKIQGTGTGARPDLPQLNLQYTNIYSGLQTRFAQIEQAVREGTMTRQQADKQKEEDYKLAQVKVDEINSVLSTQSTAFGQQVSQRGQTLTDVQGRRSFAAGAMQNSIGNVFQLGETVRPGSISGQEGLGAIRALYDMQYQAAQRAGGLREVPEIPVPPATAQVMKLSLPGGASLEIPAGLSGLQGVRDLYTGGGGTVPSPASSGAAAPGAAPAMPGAAPSNPLNSPQPAMPPQPTAMTPTSIAQSLLGESDDEDWQAGVTRAMSLLG